MELTTDFGFDTGWIGQQPAVADVVPQVFYQIWVRVVRYDDLFGSLDGAYEAWEASASAQL